DLMAAESRTRFWLEREPPVRACVVELDQDRHAVILTVHHILADGWSMRILARDLTRLYKAAVQGAEANLPAVELGPGDVAVWARGSHGDAARYWRELLGDRDPLGWLGPVASFESTPEPRTTTAALASLAVHEGLTDLAAATGTSIAVLLMAAFGAALTSWNEEDLVLGVMRANRDQPGL